MKEPRLGRLFAIWIGWVGKSVGEGTMGGERLFAILIGWAGKSVGEGPNRNL